MLHHIGQVIIPQNTHPWPHELRTAKILAKHGYDIKFRPTSCQREADMLINGVPFELKSPITYKTNSLEHVIKKALKQSHNIIIDMSRMKKGVTDQQMRAFLYNQTKIHKQIKRLILITRSNKIVDIT